jgi:hypothetical protein
VSTTLIHDGPAGRTASGLRCELRVALLDADAAWASAGPDAAVEAYRRVHELTKELYEHEWLRNAGNGHSVRTALREAAKAQRAARDSQASQTP